MNGTETLGDMAGALAAARTVEPTAGEHRADGHTHESACLNCATPLVGSHCHACGQAAHVHKTLGAFFHDLLHGVFHFEGKIWRTLPLLVTKPGKLTREYIDGRRASYVSPIALFLFCVFALFTTINSLGGDIGASVNTTVEQGLKQERNDLAVPRPNGSRHAATPQSWRRSTQQLPKRARTSPGWSRSRRAASTSATSIPAASRLPAISAGSTKR